MNSDMTPVPADRPGRRSVLRFVAGLTGLAMLAPSAFADRGSESFVQRNADLALVSLNDPKLTLEQRQKAFAELMARFADLPRISRFVLGRYGRNVSPSQLNLFRDRFTRYAIAVYATQLDQFRGDSIRVTGSIDPRAGESIVTSRISRRAGSPLLVRWRVQRYSNGEFRIIDVELGGVFLAIQQRSDFEAFLEQAGGKPEALITRLETLTAQLQAQAAARDASKPLR